MRWLAILALVSACRIGDIHFIGPGGGDDAPTGDTVYLDAPHMFDAPFAVTSHAYLLDPTSGIFVLAKSQTGDLAFTGVQYAVPVVSGVVDRVRKQLYAVVTTNPPAIRTYKIQMDGTLVAMLDRGYGQCAGQDLALSPDGNVLALGCNNGMVASFLIDAQGVVGAPQLHPINTSISPRLVVFAPTANCLYVGDATSGAGMPNLYGFTVDIQTGALTQTFGGQSGPGQPHAVGIHPSGSTLYAASGQNLSGFPVSSTCAINTASSVTGDSNPMAMAADPGGKNLFVAGSAVFSYAVTAGPPAVNAGSPYLPNPQPYAGAVIDSPGNPLYLTSPNGILIAQVTPSGGVSTMSGTVPVTVPGATNPHALLLGP